MERQVFTVAETAQILGIGRNSAYEAVRRGDIRSVRIGKRLIVPRAEICRILGEVTPAVAQIANEHRLQQVKEQ
jgi:excisionase family DNA binding protein